MAILFEYGKWETVSNTKALKNSMLDIWDKRLFVDPEDEAIEEESDKRYQPFLRFDGKQLRANNFVGFIQNEDEVIEIYPKVFRDIANPIEKRDLMLRHIFYWFGYCRKWRFPFTQASMDTIEIDSFPELIISLIAKQFLEVISNQPLNLYQPKEESLLSPRGSINFSRYSTNSLSKGNFQNVECDYEPFLFDNKVNRILKFCSRLLMNHTRFNENLRILQDIIFIFDEVEDIACTAADIESVSINSFFEDYLFLMDSCKLILNNQLYSNNTYELSQWCLLFPMEYIFEDFFAGFLEANFSDEWKVEFQKSNQFVSDVPRAFQMRHDIFLTSKMVADRKIIIDTKYKLRTANFKSDPKKGISQSDLYQMVSYAFKRGCTDLILVYPNLTEGLNSPDTFEVFSGFVGQEKINITAVEIPFWSLGDFENLGIKLKRAIFELLSPIFAESEASVVSDVYTNLAITD